MTTKLNEKNLSRSDPTCGVPSYDRQQSSGKVSPTSESADFIGRTKRCTRTTSFTLAVRANGGYVGWGCSSMMLEYVM